MQMIEKIVVPVDFAENTDKLVAYACAVAERFEAAIHFIHVVASYPGDVMIGAPFAEEYRDRIMFAAEERMKSLVEDCKGKGRTCTGVVSVASRWRRSSTWRQPPRPISSSSAPMAPRAWRRSSSAASPSVC